MTTIFVKLGERRKFSKTGLGKLINKGKKMNNNKRVIVISMFLFVCLCQGLAAQTTRQRLTKSSCNQSAQLSGVYRIDVDESDKLYSVIEGATSNVPYSEQQQFFMDLAVRLTPPDLLAIECGGANLVSLASSRASRVEFTADGTTRTTRQADGRVVRSRIGFERNSLTFTSSGGSDNVSFTFTPLENGSRLRVTRRISARELIEPVVIQTVYQKISPVARWDIFDDAQVAGRGVTTARNNDQASSPDTTARGRRTVGRASDEADRLRDALDQWIEATNARNINRQMDFYLPELQAFYLSRNATRNAVRIEKTRAFAAAKSIDIRAAEPEIIFQDGGRSAIMRFRKKYRIQNGARIRDGEVVQELRWRLTASGWKIFSERDIRVLR